MELEVRYTAFEGARRIAAGGLAEVAAKVKEVIDQGERGPVLIFNDETGEVVDVDWRQTVEESVPRQPGRPKLGVVAREVTLLPRHWEWLNSQPGGASVALRKLVEEARRANEGKDMVRRAREAVYRFATAMAGNEPGYEEAMRALFAGDWERFDLMVAAWPVDVREHAKKLASRVWS